MKEISTQFNTLSLCRNVKDLIDFHHTYSWIKTRYASICKRLWNDCKANGYTSNYITDCILTWVSFDEKWDNNKLYSRFLHRQRLISSFTLTLAANCRLAVVCIALFSCMHPSILLLSMENMIWNLCILSHHRLILKIYRDFFFKFAVNWKINSKILMRKKIHKRKKMFWVFTWFVYVNVTLPHTFVL